MSQSRGKYVPYIRLAGSDGESVQSVCADISILCADTAECITGGSERCVGAVRLLKSDSNVLIERMASKHNELMSL